MKLSILLVEDDEIDVQRIRRSLKDRITEDSLWVAENGLQALALMRGDATVTAPCPFGTVVLLDLNMPLMNGFEFLARAKEDEHLRHFPVVVLSTSQEEGDVEMSYNLGAAGYFTKPMDGNEFKGILNLICDYWSLSQTSDDGD